MARYGLASKLRRFLGDPEVNEQAFNNAIDLVKYNDEAKTIDESLTVPCALASSLSFDDNITVGESIDIMESRPPEESMRTRILGGSWWKAECNERFTAIVLRDGTANQKWAIYAKALNLTRNEIALLELAFDANPNLYPDYRIIPLQRERTPVEERRKERVEERLAERRAARIAARRAARAERRMSDTARTKDGLPAIRK